MRQNQYDRNLGDLNELLRSGAKVTLFMNGLGSIQAIHTHAKRSVDATIEEWRDHLPSGSEDFTKWPFEGVERFAGEGFTVDDALTAMASKVLHNKLPERIDGA